MAENPSLTYILILQAYLKRIKGKLTFKVPHYRKD
jgi:hypothetical protein